MKQAPQTGPPVCARETETIDLSTLVTEPLTFPEEGRSAAIRSSLFGKLFEALPLPALLIERSGLITFANKACEKIHEDYLSILGEPFSDLFPNTKIQSKALSLLEQVLSIRSPHTDEAAMKIHDRTIWARMSFRSIKLQGDRLALVLIEDLTHEKTQLKKERQHSEALRQEIAVREAIEIALRESREKLTLALKGADISLWDWEIATDSLISDDRLSEILGYNRGEIRSQRGSWAALMPREDYRSFEHDIRDLMTGRSEFLDIEHRIRTKSHGWKWVLTRGKVATRDLNGRPLRALGTILDITEHKKNQERIRLLTRDLIKAQEDERRRIALDLHDDIAQQLSSMRLLLDPVIKEMGTHQLETGQEISRISSLLQDLVGTVRNMASALRPPTLDKLGLTLTARNYCKAFSAKNDIRVTFVSRGVDEPNLDFETKIHLFRVIQEALTNVKKHADAKSVRIDLTAAPTHIMLRIRDDGRGFDVKTRSSDALAERRMGLWSMEQRVKLVNGVMSIQSKPRHGTEVYVGVPYKGRRNGR